MTVKRILADFCSWTSAHGIPHIGSAQNVCLRVFWALVCGFCVIFFAFQFALLVSNFLQYDVSVQTELRYETRPFPVVTLCLLNPHRRNALNNMPKMTTIVEHMDKALTKTLLDSEDNFGFLRLNSSGNYGIQRHARELMILAAAESDPTAVAASGVSLDELLPSCSYNLRPCRVPNRNLTTGNASDFVRTEMPGLGGCFTFNSDGFYQGSRAGSLYGLQMMLVSERSLYLSSSESIGVRLSLQGQGEAAFPDSFGFDAPVGFTTSLAVRYAQLNRKGEPYGNCTNNGDGSTVNYYPGRYTKEGCTRSCRQWAIISRCNCTSPKYPGPNDTRPCVLAEADCVLAADAEVVPGSCRCPQPCQNPLYSVTVSNAIWPADNYKPRKCATPKFDYWDNFEECLAWYGKNTLMVEIFFDRINYQMRTETAAYEIVKLISDIGGQFGLWMGISAISIIEFLSLGVLVCLYGVAKVTGQYKEDEEVNKDE